MTPVPPAPEQGNLAPLTSDDVAMLARGLDEEIARGQPDYRVMWEEAARHALIWRARFERLSDAVDEYHQVTPGRSGYAAARRELLRVWLSVDDPDVGETR